MFNRLTIKIKRSFVILAITASILSITFLQYYLQADGFSDHYPSSDALATIPEATPPLISSQQAVGYAVHQLGILPPLKETEEQASLDGWSLHVDSEASQSDQLWKVRITSIGFLPSFTCMRTFNEAGTVVSSSWPENFCAFNK